MVTVELHAQLTHRGRHFKATWPNEGPYIDLRFGEGVTFTTTPIEVINVWDYEADKARIPFEQWALAKTLKQWVLEQDREAREWAQSEDVPIDDWFATYLENQRYY